MPGHFSQHETLAPARFRGLRGGLRFLRVSPGTDGAADAVGICLKRAEKKKKKALVEGESMSELVIVYSWKMLDLCDS